MRDVFATTPPRLTLRPGRPRRGRSKGWTDHRPSEGNLQDTRVSSGIDNAQGDILRELSNACQDPDFNDGIQGMPTK